MKKDTTPELTVKVFYSDNGTDIKSELKNALEQFIEKEFKKLCLKNS